MIPRTFRFFPWLLLTLTLLAGGCGGGGGAGGGGTANTAPTLNPIGNKVVAPNNNLSFTVSASAANLKDTIQLFAEGLPSGAAFSATTGIFSWTPTSLQYGDHSVTFVASSGINETTETILISVRDNLTLTLSTQAADITENQPLSVTATASDANGAPTSLAASGLPPGASFDQATGMFTWTPQLVTPGQFPVVVTATNGIDSTSKTLIINYNRSNPLLAADITDPSLRGITIFPQTTPALDGVPELFPGQANFWDIDPDIAQLDGFWNQFEGNLLLAIDDLGVVGEELFPLDQSYAGLTFMTPLLTAHDGLKVATVADHANYAGPDPSSAIVFDPLVEGTRSAWLNATADSRLQQILDLRQSSGLLTLSWRDEFLVQSGGFFDAPEDDIPYYRVVATDLASGVRMVIFDAPRSDRNVVETAPVSRVRETRTADLSALAGKQLLLSFELRGGHQLLNDGTYLGSYALIDNVSLRDGNDTEWVENGGFESGLTGWATNSSQQSQNLRSAPRTVNGLSVTRHFYTVPNQLWARWTDVLTNNTAAPVTRRVVLRSFLGSAGFGIIYPDGSNRALTSWDGTTSDLVNDILPDRDIGLVFGSATSSSFTSSSALNTDDGSDIIEMVHDITLAPGQSVTLLHFALMSGENTGATAIDPTARATTIDTEIANILANFCSNPHYRDGMTAAQLASLQNFTCP